MYALIPAGLELWSQLVIPCERGSTNGGLTGPLNIILPANGGMFNCLGAGCFAFSASNVRQGYHQYFGTPGCEFDIYGFLGSYSCFGWDE
ncbi:hypothetical protein GQ53DRAFT_747380 [Thozetella sp. PMI_491]|nr:hypothetical protein GQ53DRAFT_747380 [Thozetella sp. PMI_491]